MCLPAVAPPSAILQLAQLLREELQAIAAARAHHDAGVERWQGWGVSTVQPGPAHDAIAAIVRQVIAEVVRIAEATLAQPGAPMKADVDDWIREHVGEPVQSRRGYRRYLDEEGESDGRWASFSPVALWAHLVEQYQPERVVQEARMRAAVALVDIFRLYRAQTVKRSGGRIELSIPRYSEKAFSSSKRRYSHSDDRLLGTMHPVLDVFAVAAGCGPAEAAALGRLGHYIGDSTSYHFEFDSRDRFDAGAGIAVVMFQSEMKVYLPSALGGALNLFVSMYAPEKLQPRA